jgi:outer membrane protein assembly factor BamB
MRRAGQFVLAAVGLVMVGGADWPGWRGPRGDGVADDGPYPLRWGPSENIRWKAEIPGRGHSSPVVCGDRVFLTSCREAEKRRILLCLDRRDGRTLWERTVLTAPPEPKHEFNSYASSTPATDGRHVWVTFLDVPHVRVACYDLDGNRIWMTSPGEFHSIHGFCASPVLFEDLVIVNCDQDDHPAYIVALEKATGKERWRADRPNRIRSYCTPLLIEAAGKPQLVLSGSKSVASYDPRSGKQWWVIDGPTEQFVASLVYADGVLCLTGGFPEHHILGIRPDGEGNVTNSAVLWHEHKHVAYVPSPIAVGKNFFLMSDEGIASCRDVRTGKLHWSERLGKRHHSSPVAANGYLYFTAEDGVTSVVKASERFERVARNSLGEDCTSSPALSNGEIFLRGVKHLYCIKQGSGTK